MQRRAAFGAAGIPAIVYKGQDYLERLYGDLGGRGMGDVDVLVRESDLEAAEQALTAAGFVPGLACRTAPHERPWTSQKGTVDLHHALLQPGRMRVDHEALFTRSLPCSAAPGFRVLEPTDALLVHSIGHTVYGLCVPRRGTSSSSGSSRALTPAPRSGARRTMGRCRPGTARCTRSPVLAITKRRATRPMCR